MNGTKKITRTETHALCCTAHEPDDDGGPGICRPRHLSLGATRLGGGLAIWPMFDHETERASRSTPRSAVRRCRSMRR